MDYAIPRQTIVDEVFEGYAVPIATPIGPNLVGVYDDTIPARPYNTTRALELLTEVFGKTYNEDIDNDTFTTNPYFNMTLVIPYPSKNEPSVLIKNSFNKVGINCSLKWWTYNIIMPRIFHDPVGFGFDFDHGGYDAIFAGFTMSPDPDYHQCYENEGFPPGANYYWLENEEIKAIWDRALNSTDIHDRIQALRDFQAWYYEEVPNPIILQRLDIFAADVDLEGFDPYHGIQQNLANITILNQTSAVIAQSWYDSNFNPFLGYSYIFDNIFVALSRRRSAYNLTHAVPWLAESWIHDESSLVWDVTLRSGIFWEDGTEVTADDVLFTYQAIKEMGILPSLQGPVHSWYDKETSVNILVNMSAVTKTGTYKIRFTFPQFYPYVETVLFSVPVLQQAQMAQIPVDEWNTDETNINFTPRGCGAYMFDKANTLLPETVVLKVNPFYNETRMGHDPLMEGGGNWLPTPTLKIVTFIYVEKDTTAMSGLQEGSYDIIIGYSILDQTDIINTSDWGKILLRYGWWCQEMGLNQYSPIWGMNPHDPRKMYLPPPPPSLFDVFSGWFFLGFVLLLYGLILVGIKRVTQKGETP
jgi:ABC-type transport system substrate-binding protein